MKAFRTAILPLAGFLALAGIASAAPVQVVASETMAAVFAGGVRTIPVTWRNDGEAAVRLAVRVRLFQAGGATAAPVADLAWKELEVLPHQTVLESAEVPFPEVRTMTRFYIQWRDQAAVLGTTPVMVYPPDLLQQLRSFGEDGLGISDPEGQIKALLRANDVAFFDLDDASWSDFSGRWALAGDFSNGQLRLLSARGVRIIWLQPPLLADDPPPAAIRVMPKRNGILVTLPGTLVNDPVHQPRAQLNLIYAFRLAQEAGDPVL